MKLQKSQGLAFVNLKGYTAEMERPSIESPEFNPVNLLSGKRLPKSEGLAFIGLK